MTPVVLLEQFKHFTKETTKDIILPVRSKPGGTISQRAPEVWLMRLPDRDAETQKAPYILLQLLDGKDTQEAGGDPSAQCHIRVVVCAYSENADEGALHVLNIITRLRIGLMKQRVVGGQFTLQLPLEYLIYPDNNTVPYFIGEMMTVWGLPTIKREVPELW